MNYFVHEHTDGSFHTVYQVPGSNVLSSVCRALTKSAATKTARQYNESQVEYHYTDPYDRKIPTGFYTDKDAE